MSKRRGQNRSYSVVWEGDGVEVGCFGIINQQMTLIHRYMTEYRGKKFKA